VEVDIELQLKAAEEVSVPREKDKEKQDIIIDLIDARNYLQKQVPKHRDALNRAVVYYKSLAIVSNFCQILLLYRLFSYIFVLSLCSWPDITIVRLVCFWWGM